MNAEIAKRSIQCFGSIIVRLPAVSSNVTASLRNFMTLRISYVTNETMKVLKDILRKYPNFIDEFLPFLNKSYLEQITETQGKAAFVWILGMFGEKIEEAPYLLEKIIEDEQDLSAI